MAVCYMAECFDLYVVEVINLQTFIFMNQRVTLLKGAQIGAPVARVVGCESSK
jgi:hypothetical protein